MIIVKQGKNVKNKTPTVMSIQDYNELWFNGLFDMYFVQMTDM